MLDFNKLAKMVDDFPTLPSVYVKVNEIISQDETTAEDVAKIIIKDQATTIKLLKLANSPVFGLSAKVDSITKAIIYIGLKEVRNIVMAISVMNSFGTANDEQNRVVRFWQHSIATGVISRYIAEKLKLKNVENYFIAGVLHDIGKLFFYKVFKKIYLDLVAKVKEEKGFMPEYELKKFSIEHTEAGYLLGKHWKLPEVLLSSIRYHEVGLVDGKFEYQTGIVHLANALAQALELGDSGDYQIYQPNITVLESLKLTPNFIKDSYSDIIELYSNTIEVLEI